MMAEEHEEDHICQETVERYPLFLCPRGRAGELIVMPRRDSLAHLDPALHRKVGRQILVGGRE